MLTQRTVDFLTVGNALDVTLLGTGFQIREIVVVGTEKVVRAFIDARLPCRYTNHFGLLGEPFAIIAIGVVDAENAVDEIRRAIQRCTQFLNIRQLVAKGRVFRDLSQIRNRQTGITVGEFTPVQPEGIRQADEELQRRVALIAFDQIDVTRTDAKFLGEI